MITKKVNRYYADCGKGYWSKKAALAHEDRCVCWSNPNERTCMTCAFGQYEHDDNGMDGDKRHVWRMWACENPDYNPDTDFTLAGHEEKGLCKHCPKWHPVETISLALLIQHSKNSIYAIYKHNDDYILLNKYNNTKIDIETGIFSHLPLQRFNIDESRCTKYHFEEIMDYKQVIVKVLKNHIRENNLQQIFAI